MIRRLLLIAVFLQPSSASAQQDAANVGAKLLSDSAIKAAVEAIRAAEPQTIDDQVRLCEIEAPPFKEAKRAEAYARMFREAGLQNVRIDKEGNVLGDRPGTQPRPRLVFSAHLDTVFPEGTDVKVKREGTLLRGPGIGDDCRGLAVLLAVIRAMNQAKLQTPGTITFVGTVGEEGLGDLRGVKYLFNEGLKGEIDRFVSIDGTGLGITHIAVGSLRYRVTFKGPGGHSYGAFGLSNPLHALGRAVEKISQFEVPSDPKTTFNVGRVGGGTSVNSIPFESWMEVDMRSADPAALKSVDANFHKAVDTALAELAASYQGTGLRLAHDGDDWQLVTAPEHAPHVAAYLGADRLRVSPASLETLAIVAYRQPVTRAEVEAIRGVNCDQTIYTLMQRRLIEERGRREAPGRPILYGTTWEFLECFGLSSLDDLPRALTPEGAIPGVGERDPVGDGSA